MKKLILIALLLIIIFSAFAAEATTDSTINLNKSIDGFYYTPYETDSFPDWTIKLRRAETLFFGGIPLTYPVVTIVSGLVSKDYNFYQLVGISASVSLAIVLIDFIIGEINEN